MNLVYYFTNEQMKIVSIINRRCYQPSWNNKQLFYDALLDEMPPRLNDTISILTSQHGWNDFLPMWSAI